MGKHTHYNNDEVKAARVLLDHIGWNVWMNCKLTHKENNIGLYNSVLKTCGGNKSRLQGLIKALRREKGLPKMQRVKGSKITDQQLSLNLRPAKFVINNCPGCGQSVFADNYCSACGFPINLLRSKI